MHTNQKTLQQRPRVFTQATSTGSEGVAVSPPVYGTESVDRTLAKAAPESLPNAPIQMRADVPADGGDDGSIFENRTGLPDILKTGVESLSGLSLDNVRVHYNSSKPAQLQALAYTQGTLRRGRNATCHTKPGTSSSRNRDACSRPCG